MAVESKVIKLRSEVVCIENRLLHEEKDINSIAQQNKNMDAYSCSLKKEIVKALRSIPIPHFNASVVNEDNLESCLGQLQALYANHNTGENNLFYSTLNVAVSQIQVA